MTKTYTPRPGSLAERVIAHLNAGATQIAPAEMATLFGAQRSATNNLLKAPRNFGMLVLHKNGNQALYTLPGVEPDWGGLPAEPKTRATPVKRKAKKAEASRSKAREAAPPATTTPPPIASLWDDGDLVLQGITVNTDGASVTLTDLQARQVHRFMERVYGPNE